MRPGSSVYGGLLSGTVTAPRQQSPHSTERSWAAQRSIKVGTSWELTYVLLADKRQSALGLRCPTGEGWLNSRQQCLVSQHLPEEHKANDLLSGFISQALDAMSGMTTGHSSRMH